MGTFPSELFAPQQDVVFAGRDSELAQLSEIYSRKSGDRFVTLFGPQGIGKTSLAHRFSRSAAQSVRWLNLNSLHSSDFAAHFVAIDSKPGELIIADGLDASETVSEAFVSRLREEVESAAVIVTSRRPQRGMTNIEIGPLPPEAILKIWQSRIPGLSFSLPEVEALHLQVGGHPLLAQLVGDLVHDRVITLARAAENLAPFVTPGIVGPDGRPISAEGRGRVEGDIRLVSSDVLRQLEKNPELLYKLTPRQFEEVVAEMLIALGYETQLTQISRDGGKDIYAARKDALGQFLYVVECKRFAPDNPVGVGVIRSLAGVVNAERANGGIVATTSFFSRDAIDFQRQLSYQITLRDYLGVREMLRSALALRGAG